jgi:hypothetical protein
MNKHRSFICWYTQICNYLNFYLFIKFRIDFQIVYKNFQTGHNKYYNFIPVVIDRRSLTLSNIMLSILPSIIASQDSNLLQSSKGLST